jgi:ribonuclease HII
LDNDHRWRNLDLRISNKIKDHLLSIGGEEKSITKNDQIWRLKYRDSFFIYFSNGTLYATPSKNNDALIKKLISYIDSIFKSVFISPSRKYVIGLSDTGRAEIAGHIILTGVMVPSNLFSELDLIINKSLKGDIHDTMKKIDFLTIKGLRYYIEKIPLCESDYFKLNDIILVNFQKILSKFFKIVDINACKLIISDYQVDSELTNYLNFLTSNGCELVKEDHVNDKYLEIKTASIISKSKRIEMLNKINKDSNFQIDGISIGSGNASDPNTVLWLKKWHKSGKKWPWFIKKSYSTIRKIEGKGVTLKTPIPIKENLLSKDFLDEFKKGYYPLDKIGISCPKCGETSKTMVFTVGGVKCSDCGEVIDDALITLRYYCGYIVPDSNIIRRGLISKDLNNKQYLKDYTFLLSPIVRMECDNAGGKREQRRLANFASKGVINLKNLGRINSIPPGLSTQERDDAILDMALSMNSIIMTGDNAMIASAMAKDVFAITLK